MGIQIKTTKYSPKCLKLRVDKKGQGVAATQLILLAEGNVQTTTCRILRKEGRNGGRNGGRIKLLQIKNLITEMSSIEKFKDNVKELFQSVINK